MADTDSIDEFRKLFAEDNKELTREQLLELAFKWCVIAQQSKRLEKLLEEKTLQLINQEAFCKTLCAAMIQHGLEPEDAFGEEMKKNAEEIRASWQREAKLNVQAHRYGMEIAKENALQPRNEGRKVATQQSALSRAKRAKEDDEKLRNAVFDLYRRNGAPDRSLVGWRMQKVKNVADYLSNIGFGAASTIEKKIGAYIRQAKA